MSRAVCFSCPIPAPPDTHPALSSVRGQYGQYHRDYSLYLAAADTTIGMVLVQDDDDGSEHVIYYLSRNLLDTETCYAYVEKLALAAICAVQRFRHYILLRTTIVISDCNPMTYILSR